MFSFDVNSLANLMIKNRVGVKGVRLAGYSLEDDFWDELAEG